MPGFYCQGGEVGRFTIISMIENIPQPIFQINDWVEYTEPNFPYAKYRGHIDQINWNEDENCWVYIFRKHGFNSLVSIPGNSPKKMAGLVNL